MAVAAAAREFANFACERDFCTQVARIVYSIHTIAPVKILRLFLYIATTNRLMRVRAAVLVSDKQQNSSLLDIFKVSLLRLFALFS